MKTTRKRKRDGTARGGFIIYSTPGSRILFFFFFCSFCSSFLFFVHTDISPHFPGIKNPFRIIRSILKLAGACTHNKLNLPRRFLRSSLDVVGDGQQRSPLSFLIRRLQVESHLPGAFVSTYLLTALQIP